MKDSCPQTEQNDVLKFQLSLQVLARAVGGKEMPNHFNYYIKHFSESDEDENLRNQQNFSIIT